jgi:tRNA pseudouridine55 synthase
MLDATKAYEFTLRLGEETTTLDAEGEVVCRSAARPSLAEVDATLPRFAGEIEQIPPAYSALKVDGKRAYDLARAGEEVALAARRVTVYQLLRTGEPREPLKEVTLAATVSKGTYIRSLARDIARALGTVGHITSLRRTKAGPFTLDRAISLDFLEEAAKARSLDGAVLPLAAGLDDIPALPVSPQDAQLLRHGQKLPGSPVQPGFYLATQDERPVALVEASGDVLQVVRGFNL